MKNLGIEGGNDALPAVVVAVTAYINDTTLNQCWQLGMVEVLNKPVDLPSLQIVVERYHKITHT